MVKISRYVTYKEAVKSQQAERLGIDNTPNEEQLKNMRFIGENIFDKVRLFVGGILFVSSFFRCRLLNMAIGGSKSSQHCEGLAIDIDADVYQSNGKTNKDIFFFILRNLEFDQLIWEFGDNNQPAWVHVSARPDGRNRKQVLRAKRVGMRTVYVPFEQAA
ncbi:D-Ala-D-Ala carboxypeptidase family metallohydrolase [Roseivirga sp. UBA1976]|uniref:D-Ala-D-Ala carboxypeptidase family metallohydrolase n=1 Tax=Roseivirga sp. UBA1976 TaxID=1947386 RepID=UPI00257990A6|nr:D-Ala-D-Ala carboxypeptidase family metallohydrolase [Roseivirga sp. UBA1976]|tara:strand:- start:244 stop:726 length:483 start_codon:yes stop_codon:yes gene_type:complete